MSGRRFDDGRVPLSMRIMIPMIHISHSFSYYFSLSLFSLCYLCTLSFSSTVSVSLSSHIFFSLSLPFIYSFLYHSSYTFRPLTLYLLSLSIYFSLFLSFHLSYTQSLSSSISFFLPLTFQIVLFLKMGHPRPLLSFIFGLFKQTLHPVSGTRIRTHDLLDVSLLL